MNSALVMKLAILLVVIVLVVLAARWLLQRLGLLKVRPPRSRKPKPLTVIGWMLIGIGALMGTAAFARAPLGDPWPMSIAAAGTLVAGTVILVARNVRAAPRNRR